MKKSTTVYVGLPNSCYCIENASSLYFSDNRDFCWVNYEWVSADSTLCAYYLDLAKLALMGYDDAGIVIDPEYCESKIREYHAIRLIALLNVAREHGVVRPRFPGFRRSAGRFRASSIRNLMHLMHDVPVRPGSPLTGVIWS